MAWFIVFNSTFNNYFSYIVAEETGVPRENLSHIVSSTPRHERGCELTTLVAIGTDCIDSYKSNYHTITAKTATEILREIYK